MSGAAAYARQPGEMHFPFRCYRNPDWAVLTLDAPLGTADRVLPLVRDLPEPGTPAMLGGYV